MIKGGYQIVDFGDSDLSSSVTKAGMHALISGCDKPFLVRGLYDGTIHFKPLFLAFIPSSTSFVASLPTGDILTVTNANACQITTPSP